MLKIVSSDVVVYTNEVVFKDDSSQMLRAVCGMAAAEATRAKSNPLEKRCIIVKCFRLKAVGIS
jgi:hypothetical protein